MQSLPQSPAPPRPHVVTFVGLVHFILGAVLVAVGLSGTVGAMEWLLLPNVRPEVLQVGLILNGVMTLVVGGLMWSGARVGWHVSVAALVASAVRNVAGFMVIQDVLDEFGMPLAGLKYYYAAYVLRAIAAIACVQLFMGRPVAEYFRIDEERSGAFVGLCVAIVVLVAGGVYALRRSFA